MAETQSAPSLRELSERATQGEWHHRQAGVVGARGALDWIGDAPDGSQHTKIIVGRQCLYGGSHDYAFLARLVSDYRAGRFIDPTTLSEAVASARAEGVREGLERAAKLFEARCAAKRGELADNATTDVRWQLDLHHEMRAAEQAASDIRALIPAPPTTPGGR